MAAVVATGYSEATLPWRGAVLVMAEAMDNDDARITQSPLGAIPIPDAIPDHDERSRRAWWQGVREGFGVPGLVLFGSFLGFGSLVHGSGIGLLAGLVSSLTIWALPGQIAMVELYGIGASLLVNGLAVWLTNTRLMPMVITLMPQLDDGRGVMTRHYVLAHVIAITSWAVALRRCPELPVLDRVPFFTGFAVTLWGISFVATAVGFALAGSLPKPVMLGLVFLNPCYFLLLFVADLGPRIRILALVGGAVLGPVLHRVNPDWGLLATGLIGGTAAFVADRAWRRWEARRWEGGR